MPDKFYFSRRSTDHAPSARSGSPVHYLTGISRKHPGAHHSGRPVRLGPNAYSEHSRKPSLGSTASSKSDWGTASPVIYLAPNGCQALGSTFELHRTVEVLLQSGSVLGTDGCSPVTVPP